MEDCIPAPEPCLAFKYNTILLYVADRQVPATHHVLDRNFNRYLLHRTQIPHLVILYTNIEEIENKLGIIIPKGEKSLVS